MSKCKTCGGELKWVGNIRDGRMECPHCSAMEATLNGRVVLHRQWVDEATGETMEEFIYADTLAKAFGQMKQNKIYRVLGDGADTYACRDGEAETFYGD